ncbi:hypothetical protein CFC21_075861 [Triticum aestivum]|uniref:Uncharacterized protein n=2 Tax=Triticum aestivum TaxID=4565 RepID=A0A3B6MJA6_WHEAT|nr:nardilysin-like isoform X2 [Triticum aestivum]KAF7070331.1 hypothetical protein CFC21_075861 [Triticum aestivum]
MAGPGSGRPPGGEGNCGVIYSPYPQSSPLAPRLTYLFQQFGLDKIGDIMNRPDGKTFQQRIDHLREELDAFERARDIFYMVEVDEDDEYGDEDEDETDENLLGDEDEEKPDIAKRPHAPVEGELECKKPKTAQDLRCRL